MDKQHRAEQSVLYVVATPIGNLGDMTYRAVAILESVDLVAAEDTRHTSRLLSFYNISANLISCHEHNEAQRARQLVEKMRQGQSVALVSDAGTPSVSDPGYRIVREAVDAGIRVVPIPGASAAIAAISASGMPSDMFSFIGFVPKKKNRQDAVLVELSERNETLVFYESPRRVIALLRAIGAHMGDRHVVIARELTKIHETFMRGPISRVIAELDAIEKIRGEVTLLVAGKQESKDEDPGALEEEIERSILEDRLSPSRLAAGLAKRYNVSKNEIYQKILTVQARLDAMDHNRGDSSDG